MRPKSFIQWLTRQVKALTALIISLGGLVLALHELLRVIIGA